MYSLALLFTASAFIVNRVISSQKIRIDNAQPRNTQELQDSLKRFVAIIGQSPKATFYENWKVLGETIFHPKQLLLAVEKDGQQAERCIRIVLRFMGFPQEVYASSDLKATLKELHKSKTPCSFDDDHFTELLFRVVDVNHTDYVDVSELREMITNFVLTGEDFKQDLFHGFDKEKKNQLNLREFQAWWEDAFNQIAADQQ